MRVSSHRLGLIALVASLASACGSKTGLEVPDAGPDAGSDAGPDAGPDAAIPCYEIPFDGGVVEVPLDIAAELGRADVLFLVDVTASMQDEIDQIAAGLRDRIAPGITAAVPDSFLGVASLGDFPEGMCGDAGDRPFQLLLPMTNDLNAVQAAVGALTIGNGLDRPEAQVEALYQVATGMGLGVYVPPSFGCPRGGVGYPCFRLDALPIVVLFTDAPFHNGPSGNPYRCTVFPPPHTYSEMLEALSRLDIRVIGMYSGDGEGLNDINRVAVDTGAVDDGSPLVFNIGERGERLSTSVVDAITTLADTIEFDVDTFLVDPDPDDGVDPRDFVERVEAVRAEPMDRVRRIDREAGIFYGVQAGTRVFYRLLLRGGAVVPGTEPRRFRLEIVFRGDGRTRLGSRIVEFVIPSIDGQGCEPS
ncbi:MAG: hypothetical protein IT378_27200 [Sandaracinaceae bacterium]|nr:hypothetical protein [Sandaracinaceae bacterium]